MSQVGREISSIPRCVRAGIFVMAALGCLAWGAVFGSSPSEAFHLAVVPALACYALLFRPSVFRQIAPRHILYFTALAMLVGAYLLAFSHMTTQAASSWTEVPLTLYFLLAVHLVVYGMDRVAALAARLAPGIGRSSVLPARLARVLLRIVLVVALAGPYLVSTFLVHWVKFGERSDPQSLAGIEYGRVRFQATDGVGIEAWWLPCRDHACDATVILVGERAQAKLSFLLHAQLLQEKGYHVLMPDLRGSGQSDGHTRSFGSLEARDVLGAVRFLKAARPAMSRHVFVMGIGDGAGAALAAAQADPSIQAVVLDSPCGSIDSALEKVVAPLPEAGRGVLRWAVLRIASLQLGTDLSKPCLREAISQLKDRPVLIIQGREDTIAPPQQAEELFRSASSPAVLWQIPGAPHTQSILLARFHYGRNVRTVFESARRNCPDLLRLIDPEDY